MKFHGLVSTPQMPVVYAERELDWDDLGRLANHRAVGQQRLKKIRSVHHKIARMMAAGCANVEIAAAVGMDNSRISWLAGDPSFQELLEHYKEAEYDAWREVRERAAMLGVTAAEIIMERMEEKPDSIPTDTLLNLMKGGLDYGGHKPAERSENLHVHTTQDQIERAKAGRREAVTVREPPSGDDSLPDDAIDTEFTEAEDRASVREESAEGDQEEILPDSESVAGGSG